MNKKVRGFILTTLALSFGFFLTAQSPSNPGIQGRVIGTGKLVPVQVDKNGVVQVSSSSGAGCPNPCPVVGTAADGAVPTGNPILAAGFDGTNTQTLLTDTSGRQIVTPQAAVGAASGNPFPTGYRDDSGNVLADYGFPDQAAVTISAGTDTVIVSGVMSTNTYVGHISFSLDSAQTVTIRQGTGSTCGTNTAILYGPAPNVTAVALDYDSKGPLHTTVAARDLCLHLGGSATVGGGIVYGTH
jgi:hypothetical protein